MPTPSSDTQSLPLDLGGGEWTARTDTPKRSVFGNYRANEAPAAGPAPGATSPQHAGSNTCVPPSAIGDLQSAIDVAVARSFLHGALARAFEDPTPEGWATLAAPEFHALLARAVAALAERSPDLAEAARRLTDTFTPEGFGAFHDAYLAAFGHAARGPCPLNEIEYGDLKADGLFQPHRLADLAAFYRAFGLEVADDATERHDHICLELEFMSVLAAKEAWALEHRLDAGALDLCREAQKKFLREHLGRWTPAFARRLAGQAARTPLAALAHFTRAFIEAECARRGVPAGSEDLLLRPVNEMEESLCASCGGTSTAVAPVPTPAAVP